MQLDGEVGQLLSMMGMVGNGCNGEALPLHSGWINGKYNRLMLDVVGGTGATCLLPSREIAEGMDAADWMAFLDNK